MFTFLNSSHHFSFFKQNSCLFLHATIYIFISLKLINDFLFKNSAITRPFFRKHNYPIYHLKYCFGKSIMFFSNVQKNENVSKANQWITLIKRRTYKTNWTFRPTSAVLKHMIILGCIEENNCYYSCTPKKHFHRVQLQPLY